MVIRFPADLAAKLESAETEWQRAGKVARLWARDATLWTGADEARWMGWLDIAGRQLADVSPLDGLARDVRQAGFRDALLIGMGGSSLAPEVLATTFGAAGGSPRLHVIDSVDPAQVARVEQRLDLDRALFIVSSKSGSTLEPNILLQYFFDRVRTRLGERAGSRFIAVTDPGSGLERVAARDGFWKIFPGVPEIGGRFSALSNFGLVPAATIGLDVTRLLQRADGMARACGPGVPVSANPGARLGLALGAACLAGRDKLTLVTSPAMASLGAWLEQLVAESTGKQGRAIIPVDGERLAAPGTYGADRVFVYTCFSGRPDAMQDAAMDRLQAAGHPVVRIDVGDLYDLPAEFFRWEIATAVAGAMLGINPFDQPDVEASKVATRRLTEAYEQTGSLPPESPILEDAGLKFFADEANAAALATSAGSRRSAHALLDAHLSRVAPGDYVALLAYLDMSDAHVHALQEVRHLIADRVRVATALGFGPRFLHSTGQAYKGGPNTGVFLQITCDDGRDLAVPGRRYTFGVVKAAQARGDLEVLASRGRRVLRVHLGSDVPAGIATLRGLVEISGGR
jgi:transaldolase/glucose-6-phosphate isomerase